MEHSRVDSMDLRSHSDLCQGIVDLYYVIRKSYQCFCFSIHTFSCTNTQDLMICYHWVDIEINRPEVRHDGGY